MSREGTTLRSLVTVTRREAELLSEIRSSYEAVLKVLGGDFPPVPEATKEGSETVLGSLAYWLTMVGHERERLHQLSGALWQVIGEDAHPTSTAPRKG